MSNPEIAEGDGAQSAPEASNVTPASPEESNVTYVQTGTQAKLTFVGYLVHVRETHCECCGNVEHSLELYEQYLNRASLREAYHLRPTNRLKPAVKVEMSCLRPRTLPVCVQCLPTVIENADREIAERYERLARATSARGTSNLLPSEAKKATRVPLTIDDI